MLGTPTGAWGIIPQTATVCPLGLGEGNTLAAALRFSCSWQQPGHDALVWIAAARDLMLLDRFAGKSLGLLPRMPFISWLRHPFADDGSPRSVLRSHQQFLSNSAEGSSTYRRRFSTTEATGRIEADRGSANKTCCRLIRVAAENIIIEDVAHFRANQPSFTSLHCWSHRSRLPALGKRCPQRNRQQSGADQHRRDQDDVQGSNDASF
jgi:hypothetical protein